MAAEIAAQMLQSQEHSCWWRTHTAKTKVPAVAIDQNSPELAAQICAWLKAVMQETGLSVSEWAKRANVARTTISRPLADGYEFVTSSRTLDKLARAAGVPPPPFDVGPTANLMRGSDMSSRSATVAVLSPLRPVQRRIPILGEVEAGSWREPRHVELAFADNFDDEEFARRGVATVAVDVQGYERARLFGLRVRGPSMNKEYAEGRILIVAPAAEAGIRNGDHVVVQRHDSAGKIETTVKELVVDADGRARLWPRSTHEDHQEPIELNPRSGDQDRPKIIGVVVGDYSRRQRPDQPAFFSREGDDYAD